MNMDFRTTVRSVTLGILGAAMVGLAPQAVAQDAADAMPTGRTAVAITDGVYPASYFPNTETLGADELRVIALGTGMPNQTKAAVSISFLVELGNGDKFLFDIGSGSTNNLFSLRPDFSKLDKVFFSHLHVDHVGDFMGLHVGAWLSGRYTPLRVFGPTGSTPELGTKAYVEGMKQAYAWDLQTRTGALPDKGAEIEVTEFDFKQENVVVYEENGVTVRSWPAIHSLDGSVSYSLEWNGLKYVFGGDTYPNKWYVEYAAGADLASHECFLPPQALSDYFGWDLSQATYVSTRVHTEPAAFGKVMDAVKPRHAMGYHSVLSPENFQAILEGVRTTYDGELTLARDLTVINVTKDQIVVREASVDEYVLPPSVTQSYIDAPRSDEKSPSDWTMAGKWEGYTPPPMPDK
ncbi:guanitoxin biosynthesis MBL fold metallo-hydrolase GntH [Tropicimonas sp. TH_r6]|uniref:guanitoxin biosynthesis MBL fold metallo-hydrolase GntH n=1 Tax=Tropicimonas sp. TH_r6 TaxID=3082085 RepID=UPI002954D9F1|nr:guanitoxin biosynthesis MBL fold metallo-hydrolase GntH [Tropicimonas sp. TH_r6]MDV7144296.1 guanitoxin biosynthesis MBL fold metallo-hydrolase GntH [Tropicimonas sp. TH_r6]